MIESEALINYEKHSKQSEDSALLVIEDSDTSPTPRIYQTR